MLQKSSYGIDWQIITELQLYICLTACTYTYITIVVASKKKILGIARLKDCEGIGTAPYPAATQHLPTHSFI